MKTAQTAGAAAATRVPARLGSYRLLAPLGRGGMSIVFRGVHVVLERPAAIKVLTFGCGAADPAYAARFQREAQIAARLQHPNIVSTFDTGYDHGLLWIAMELVEGSSVVQLLGRAGRLQPLEALSIVRQVALALEVTSRAGIAHRDVKPDNIIVTATGVAKLADLGLAREISARPAARMTAKGLVVGTPEYSAPEVVAGLAIDDRVDVYSLGVTLFQMLTGEIPLLAESRPQTMLRHVREDVPPPSSLVSGMPPIPPEVDDLVRGMTARDPSVRLSAAQVAARIGQILDPAARDDAAAGPSAPARRAPTARGQPAARRSSSSTRAAARRRSSRRITAVTASRKTTRRRLAVAASSGSSGSHRAAARSSSGERPAARRKRKSAAARVLVALAVIGAAAAALALAL